MRGVFVQHHRHELKTTVFRSSDSREGPDEQAFQHLAWCKPPSARFEQVENHRCQMAPASRKGSHRITVSGAGNALFDVVSLRC